MKFGITAYNIFKRVNTRARRTEADLHIADGEIDRLRTQARNLEGKANIAIQKAAQAQADAQDIYVNAWHMGGLLRDYQRCLKVVSAADPNRNRAYFHMKDFFLKYADRYDVPEDLR